MTVLVLRPVAVVEVTEAHAHHRGQVDELFARLTEFPRSAPLVPGYRDVRRTVVRGFPSVVFYRHQPDRIEVLRVLHGAWSDAERSRGESVR